MRKCGGRRVIPRPVRLFRQLRRLAQFKQNFASRLPVSFVSRVWKGVTAAKKPIKQEISFTDQAPPQMDTRGRESMEYTQELTMIIQPFEFS